MTMQQERWGMQVWFGDCFEAHGRVLDGCDSSTLHSISCVLQTIWRELRFRSTGSCPLSLMTSVSPRKSLDGICSPTAICSARSRYLLGNSTFPSHHKRIYHTRTAKSRRIQTHFQIRTRDSSQVRLGLRRGSSRAPVRPWTTFC